MHRVIEVCGRPPGGEVLRGMFAARKSVFVDLLRWDLPVLADCYEVDQFDDEHAVYLVLTDHESRHLGSARLLPTTRPHILDTLYPQLCEGGPPRGPATLEITRFCLDRKLSAAQRRAVRDTLVCALADYALAHGVRHYSAIAGMAWLSQILAFGWHCVPLGLPMTAASGPIGAIRIDIAPETPALLRSAGLRPFTGFDEPPARAA